MNTPILYIFSGLPGSGKTTLSQMLAQHKKAVHLRIDTIEQALRDLCSIKVEGEGSRLSYRIAEDNLRLGISVIAYSCNPIELTRNEWEQVAKNSNSNYINIETICSKKSIHKNRVETRENDIANLNLPTWESVESREYDSWMTNRIVVDTTVKNKDGSFKSNSLQKLGKYQKHNQPLH